MAEAARRGRFTHVGVDPRPRPRPDWIDGGLADDVEWRIEWVKLYEGLDLAHAYALTGDDRLPRRLGGPRRVVLRSGRRRTRRVRRDGPSRAELAVRLAALRARRRRSPGCVPVSPSGSHDGSPTTPSTCDSNLTPHRNHRTLELYALLLVGLSLPDERPRSGAVARSTLLGENLLTDVWPDGVHRECSTDYHCIVLRSFLGALANARAAGLELPDGYVDRVSLALDFALHVQRPDGLTPSFSDGDIVDFRRLLALGAELLDRDRTCAGWPRAARRERHRRDRRRDFPVGGYCTLRSGWGDGVRGLRRRALLLIDCRPDRRRRPRPLRPAVGRAVRGRPLAGRRPGSLHVRRRTTVATLVQGHGGAQHRHRRRPRPDAVSSRRAEGRHVARPARSPRVADPTSTPSRPRSPARSTRSCTPGACCFRNASTGSCTTTCAATASIATKRDGTFRARPTGT